MRWLRYQGANGIRYGIVEGQTVAEIDTTPFVAWQRTGATAELHAVKTLVPVIPGTFYAIGAELSGACGGVREHAGRAQAPAAGYRANSALIADGENIVIPAESGGIQYEGELVAVIGKTGRYVPERDALSIVLGYTIGNDVSERTWQKADNGLWRAKNADTFKPMGPWIETDVDLPSLITRVRVNGRQMLEFQDERHVLRGRALHRRDHQVHDAPSGRCDLDGHRGSNADLRAGDVCEIELDQIGTLRNPVVAESPRHPAP